MRNEDIRQGLSARHCWRRRLSPSPSEAAGAGASATASCPVDSCRGEQVPCVVTSAAADVFAPGEILRPARSRRYLENVRRFFSNPHWSLVNWINYMRVLTLASSDFSWQYYVQYINCQPFLFQSCNLETIMIYITDALISNLTQCLMIIKDTRFQNTS